MKVILFIVCGMLSVTFQLKAQSCDFANLVFEGAGIRGIAYAGVIEELEKQGKLNNIKKVGGTSAGALMALMVSLGYNFNEIADIISSTRFNKFNDGRFMFIGGLIRMKRHYGWYRGHKLNEWVAALIEHKTGNSEITFKELSQYNFKDLYITAVCLNRQNLIIFSKETYPDMKVKDAVTISMTIPLYFKAVLIDSIGKVYHKANNTQKLDVVVDGGIIGNFPIFIFDSLEVGSANKKLRFPEMKTIGVRIDSDIQIEYDRLTRELAPVEINNFNDYLSAFYNLILENLNRGDLTEEDWSRTISISSVGISPKIKRLSKEEKEKLIESGRRYTAKFIMDRCNGIH